MVYQGLIFDLDGTLINSYPLTLKYLGQVIMKYGDLNLSEEQIGKLFGPSEKMIFKKLVKPELVERCYEEYFNLFQENVDEITPFYGIPEILHLLQSSGRQLAIFTGRGRELTLYLLQQVELSSYFNIVVTSEDVTHHKPSPEGVLKICSLLKRNPSEILHIGDSRLDILSGKKAGVATGGALWGSRNQQQVEEAEPDYLFHHPGEIEEVV